MKCTYYLENQNLVNAPDADSRQQDPSKTCLEEISREKATQRLFMRKSQCPLEIDFMVLSEPEPNIALGLYESYPGIEDPTVQVFATRNHFLAEFFKNLPPNNNNILRNCWADANLPSQRSLPLITLEVPSVRMFILIHNFILTSDITMVIDTIFPFSEDASSFRAYRLSENRLIHLENTAYFLGVSQDEDVQTIWDLIKNFRKVLDIRYQGLVRA